MAMLSEFREFLQRGNLVDMAVGIAVGTAFATIARSLVGDIIMPPVGLVLGGVEFSDLYWILRQGVPAGPYLTLAAAQEAGAVTVNYGLFVNNVLAFLIIAATFFMILRSINRLQREQPGVPEAPTTKPCPFCTMTIPLAATRCPECTSEVS